MNIYLETGKKRVFAAALDWPGWCRSAKDKTAALETLLAYGERYARVLQGTSLDFTPPLDPSAFQIIERLSGTSSTDFGAPAAIPAHDRTPMSPRDYDCSKQILGACWAAFDQAAAHAQGRELRKGPRGGVIWPSRYFVRRVAWHLLDHLWEIKDRQV